MTSTLRLRADIAELPRLTEWIDARVAALALDDRQAYALRLCIEELAGNVLQHGAANALQVTLRAPPLCLLVEDDGPAFDPLAVAAPTLPGNLDAATPGGLGLLLTRHYSRDLAYARHGGWNRVSVRL